MFFSDSIKEEVILCDYIVLSLYCVDMFGTFLYVEEHAYDVGDVALCSVTLNA